MPNDRTTELLWNYIGMAQFADLFRWWGTGPADMREAGVEGPQALVISASVRSAAPEPADEEMNANVPVGLEGITVQPLMFHSAEPSAPVPLDIGTVDGMDPSAWKLPGLALPRASGLHGESQAAIAQTGSVQQPDNGRTEPPPLKPPSEPAAASGEATQVVESGGNVQTNTVTSTVRADHQPMGWVEVGATEVQSLTEAARLLASSGSLQIDTVWGDVTTVTAVQQVNVLLDGDLNLTALSALAAGLGAGQGSSTSQSTSSGANRAENSATLVTGGSDYDALFVSGNFYEYNKIFQINVIIDDDQNLLRTRIGLNPEAGGVGGKEYGQISSGSNWQLNQAFIVDQDDDCVHVIGGRYAEFFSANQLNYLVDTDLNQILWLLQTDAVAALAGLASGASISSGGNTQSNVAGFLGASGGGALNGSWTGQGHDLFSLLAFADLHPGQGPLRALFVDGDYSVTNLIVQINFIFDRDVNTHSIGSHAGFMDNARLNYDQIADSGDNEAENYAYLIDADGGVGLRVIGGNYYEYNSINQINIIIDADFNRVDHALSSTAAATDVGVQDVLQISSTDDALNRMSG